MKNSNTKEAPAMTTMTIGRSNELREESTRMTIAAPIPFIGNLEIHLAAYQLDELKDLLGPGESLVTDKFLDERITGGKEYEVRAIGEKRYAKFVGRLKQIRSSYGWVLTFEDVKYMSADESLRPVMERGLVAVPVTGASLTLYLCR